MVKIGYLLASWRSLLSAAFCQWLFVIDFVSVTFCQ